MKKLVSILTVIVLIGIMFSTITLNVSAAGSNVYEFEVKTKNVAYAGTDAKISYKLVGDKGETDWVVSNGAIKGNAYVQNMVDKFELTFSKEVGTVQKLLIKSNQQWASPDWQCEFVIVKQQGTDKSYSFVIDEWFNNKNEHEYVYNNKINCYRFEVKTGSIDGAGTQKKLELGLVGANGESSLLYANSYAVDGVYSDAVKDATKIPFQKGKTETFIIPFKEDIGKLQAFAACCDYASWGDGNWIEPRNNDSWFCEYATVTNVDDVTDKISVSTNSWFRGSEKWVYEKDDLRYLVRIKMDKSGKRGENDNGYLFYIGAISDNPDWQYESLFSTDYDDTFVYDSVKKEYTVVTRLSEDALNALNDIDQIRIGIRYSWINVYEVTFQQYNNGAGLGPEIKFTGPGKKLEAYYYNAQPHDTLTRPGASIVGSIFGGSNIWIMIAIAVILIGGGVATVIILKKKKATAVVEMSEEQT